MPCAVILTALPVEYLAVRAHLSNLQEETHSQGTIYECGKFVANGQGWEVGIVEIGAGNSGAALEAERAISYFAPNVILFVGVAGGIKDVALGDVVASTKIYGYESGKAEQRFKPRPEIGLSAYSLEQRARAEARKGDWLQRLSFVPELTPRVFVAPIAAGEKVIASTQSEVFQFLHESYGDVIAVEMEGLGFLEAAQANQRVSAIVIRGISDLIYNKIEADQGGYQVIAVRHASAFAFELLAKLKIGSQDLRESHQENTILDTNSQQRQRLERTPFQVPPLPSHFVERPEISRDLKSHLLEANTTTGTLVVSAIHGLGGIGKSTLAAALAHESDVLNRFPDGIFWATLGQQPDVLSLLTSWVQALGDYDFRPTNIEAASRHLCSLLHKKAALLVVDDVWNVDHVLPFRVGSSKCRVLITTRIADIAGVVGATLYNLDVMTEAQALALLEGRIKRNLKHVERKHAQALAEAVEYLPLALELAAAQVTDGIPWTELLDDLQAEIARLDILDLPGAEEANDEITRKKLSLLASFNLSLWRLSQEKRQKFAWLGVVPEDVTLTQGMVTTLWETDVRKARGTLRYLRDKALLLEAVPLADGTRTYRLHDLLHDLSRRLLTSPPLPEREGDLPGLGLTLAKAHAAMLERYRKFTKASLWHHLSDDGYIYNYLTWHMEQAGWEDDLYALLKEQTSEGKNGWYQARDRLGQIAGYLTDVTRAWKLAEDAFTKHKSLNAIGLQVRYALITASLNSMANNISPDLLEALVEKKIWTAEQGIVYARQKPDMTQKSLTLVMIAPYLPETEMGKIYREALTTAREQDGYYYGREAALSRLQKLIINEYTKTLVERVPNCPESLLQEALAIIRMFKGNQKLFGLSMLVPYLSASQSEVVTQELLKASRKLLEQDENIFAQHRIVKQCLFDTELRELAPYLPKQLRQILSREVQIILDRNYSFLQEGNSLDSRHHRQQVAGRTSLHYLENLLSSRLQEPELEEVISEIQEAMSQLRQNFEQLLGSGYLENLLSSRLQRPELKEVINKIEVLESSSAWNQYLYDLKKRLTDSQSKQLLRENIALPREIKNESQLQAAVIEARLLQDQTDIATTLVAISSHLSESLLEEILVAVLSLQNEDEQIELLVFLASYLSEPLLSKALTAVQAIKNENSRVAALIGLSPFIQNLLSEKALIIAKELKDEELRERALINLIPQLPNSLQVTVFEETLAEIQARCEKRWLVERAESMQGGIRIKDVKELQVETLINLTFLLPEPFKEKLLREASYIARDIKDKTSRTIAIRLLIPHLLRPQLEELLPTVKALRDEFLLTDMIVKLAPDASESLLKEGLKAAQTIVNSAKKAKKMIGDQELNAHSHKAKVLAKLAPYLKDLLLEEALIAAREIKYEEPRISALAALACYLQNPQKERVLEEVFKFIYDQKWGFNGDFLKREILIEVAPHLSNKLLKNAFTIVDTIDHRSSRIEALAILVCCLPESQRKRVFLEKIWTKNFTLRGIYAIELVELKSSLPESLLALSFRLCRANI
jgi:nucleoside phosphorylase